MNRYYRLVGQIEQFYKLAEDELSKILVHPEGMRQESFNYLRKNKVNKPIEIEVYPDNKAYLADGRHRLEIAIENNRKFINCVVRYYDEDANIIKEKEMTLPTNVFIKMI